MPYPSRSMNCRDLEGTQERLGALGMGRREREMEPEDRRACERCKEFDFKCSRETWKDFLKKESDQVQSDLDF